ncbi:hypothetical protein ACQPW3_17840 [Actinosynnema sp. CA-248983]
MTRGFTDVLTPGGPRAVRGAGAGRSGWLDQLARAARQAGMAVVHAHAAEEVLPRRRRGGATATPPRRCCRDAAETHRTTGASEALALAGLARIAVWRGEVAAGGHLTLETRADPRVFRPTPPALGPFGPSHLLRSAAHTAGMSASPGRLLAVPALLVALSPAVASAAQAEEVIVLPGATSAEGITTGRGSTFYAGDLFAGDIFRGDLRAGTAERFIDVEDGSRMAVGMTVHEGHHLLFVAGGFLGTGYVYDLDTGATVATYRFAAPGTSLINDVTLTHKGAWFTDSFSPVLHFVPINPLGTPGPHKTLTLSGPAADVSGQFNNNGIAATPDGRALIVAHTDNGLLNTVDPKTGASATIAGVSVPFVDGILVEAGRLWAVQNFLNTVVEVDLSPDLTSGAITKTYTSPNFQVPATIARHGNRLAVVNAKFDTGFPPTADQYEVVVFPR